MSQAVGTERVSGIVGYQIVKGNFNEVSPNLPQRIVLLGEANDANQAGIDTTGVLHTTAQSVGEQYGYGSPLYAAMRILHPLQGDGVGGIPVQVYPQAAAGAGEVAKVITITPVGTATKAGTIYVSIAGREGLDGQTYNVAIAIGDAPTTISTKMRDVVNAVLGTPVTAAVVTTTSVYTAKWKGLTSDEITITIDNTEIDDSAVTYGIVNTTAGSGTPSIQAALDQFGNDWNTIIVNTYGTESGTMTLLEAFNGKPDPTTPTGRYSGIIFKPFIALTGSLVDDPSSITDAKKEDVTIAICPAPLSKGLSGEAAANMCRLYARQAQDSPHLDVSGQSYPDMPTPLTIGSMETYNSRDLIVKKGCSTVELSNAAYKVVDFVTTYHPDGEIPPQFRYCRNLNLDMNIRFGYLLLEAINVVDHAIANDDDTVTVASVVKPKMWKALLDAYADELALRALIVDADFMQASITVAISGTNPDRLESFFKYKRSGYARISSTIAEAGFNFGNI